MLLVKTYIAPSKIHGIGLFAGQEIKKGDWTFKFQPGFDFYLSTEEVAKLPEVTQNFIKTYCALSPTVGKYVVYGDDARFANHSVEPNIVTAQMTGELEPPGIAKRDIAKGEELTVDYRTFDKLDAVSDERYLGTR